MNTSRAGISAGTGIALAGIWLAMGGLSAVITLIMFVWTEPSDPETTVTFFGLLIVLTLCALPVIVAYSITKMILNRYA